jgi:arylsulfatase
MARSEIDRRSFLGAAVGALFGGIGGRAETRAPNIVLILADDLGFGDLGCYGSRIPTPNLNRLAAEGAQFQHFYAGSPVCTPSRAALLTGRYPVRCGLSRVLFPEDTVGLSNTETTVPKMLKSQGYRTMCAGKWHLGSRPEFMPNAQGFDRFFGIPYSHDMWPLPLLSNGEVVEANAKLDTLTQRYTEQAIDFVSSPADAPFFLYLAHSAPHIPLATSQRFRKKSKLGRYGDAVQELDWSVGEVMRTIAEKGLDDNTLVMFTSDNGPWYQGNTGVLRGRKGETYEGGVRVPCLVRFPGRIPAGVQPRGFGSFFDVMPTLARLTGATAPRSDGTDIWPLMAGQASELERDLLLYFDGINLQCARMGPWKLHVSRYNSFAWTLDPPGGRMNLPLPRPELYDLESDPEESSDVAEDNPEIVARIRARMEQMLLTFPEDVIAAWRDTMRTPVEATESGALPVRKI